MASFDENGKYIKTNWKAGDKITATKLNKIEESIEAVNDNDISRHVEADARLDALEAKDAAHDKEFTNVKNTIADNKAAAELGDYEINSRMTFLEDELNEGIEEVHNVASTVDGKIATAEANMKADMEAMIAEADLEGLHAKDEELSEQLTHNASKLNQISLNVKDFGAKGDGITDDTESINESIRHAYNNGVNRVYIPAGKYLIKAHDETSTDPHFLLNSGGIEMLDNITLELDNNTILKAIPNSRKNYNIIRIVNKQNVCVLNGTIQGERGDHQGSDGEWGYGIFVSGGKNITIKNIKAIDMFGDGINNQVYKPSGDSSYCTENLIIDSVICDNNMRQGMSLEGVIGCVVKDSIFKNTNGTSSGCGVDIEPYSDTHITKDIVFNNCRFENNDNAGLLAMGVSVSNVTVNNCWFSNNGKKQSSFGVTFIETNYGFVNNCNFDNDCFITHNSNYIKFTNNTFFNSYGLIKSNSNFIQITKNLFKTEQALDTLTITNQSNDILIDNNNFEVNLDADFIIGIASDDCNRVNIKNNILIGSKRSLSITGALHSIEFNSILNSTIAGIYATSTDNLLISENIFAGNCLKNNNQYVINATSMRNSVIRKNIFKKEPYPFNGVDETGRAGYCILLNTNEPHNSTDNTIINNCITDFGINLAVDWANANKVLFENELLISNKSNDTLYKLSVNSDGELTVNEI